MTNCLIDIDVGISFKYWRRIVPLYRTVMLNIKSVRNNTRHGLRSGIAKDWYLPAVPF